MNIGFAFDGEAAIVGDAVRKFCTAHFGAGVHDWAKATFSRRLWTEIADLGVFTLGPAPSAGGFGALAAAFEELGRVGCPGPLATTAMLAGLAWPQGEAVIEGRSIAAVGEAPIMPWGGVADIFIDLRGDEAWLIAPQEVVPAATLGDAQCARVSVASAVLIGPLDAVWPRHDVALAAYLAAAAETLVDAAAAHVASRRQFGRPVGDFQGVALPLADAAARADAARTLARAAARQLDDGVAGAAELAALARVSAGRAARRAAFAAHQSHGALGVTHDGPVFWLSRRIQDLCLQPPAEARARARLAPTLAGSLGLLARADGAGRAARWA